MQQILVAIVIVTLLAVVCGRQSGAEAPPFSRETLYVAKRQFEADHSSLLGVWRWVPGDVTFSEDSVSALLARSFGTGSVKEIGRMRIHGGTFIVAVVVAEPRGDDVEAKKYFVFFREDTPIVYKVFDFNPMQLIVPPPASPASAIKDACAMVHARLGSYPHTLNRLRMGPDRPDGRHPHECRILFKSDRALLRGESVSPVWAFIVKPGDELFREGWMSDPGYAVNGEGGMGYAMRNEQVRCEFYWDWDRPPDKRVGGVVGETHCYLANGERPSR